MNTIQFGRKKKGVHYFDRPGAYAVIVNDDHEIGIIEQDNFFFLPGGGIEKGENKKDALLREVREETGIEIKIEQFLGNSNEYQNSFDHALTFNQIGYFYKCRIIADHKDQSDLSHKFKWLKFDAFKSKLRRRSHLWALNISLNMLDEFSVQDGQGIAKGRYRLIRDDELDALLQLYEHLHENDAKPGNTADYKETWNEIVDNPQILYFGAELNGALISSCHLVITPNLTRGCSPYGTIENVVCKKEYRSMGIGKGVLRYALTTAWALGCYKVMLMTGSKNEWVYRFYENAGFQRNIKTAFYAKPQ